MGNKQTQRLTATVCVPAGAQRCDYIRLSYSRITCWWRRRKTIAAFSFPREGWHVPPSGMFVNACTKAESVRLDRLSGLDAATPVAVRGVTGDVEVFHVNVQLGDLLAALSLGPQGGWTSKLDLTFTPVSLRGGEQARGDVLLAAYGGAPLFACSAPYALYCNGRYCGESTYHLQEAATPPNEQGSNIAQLATVPANIKQQQPNERSIAAPREEAPAVGVPRPKRPTASETYYVRLIVHAVEEIQQFGEFFPDLYVKARMKVPPRKWHLTDVHLKAVNARALFEYRLVMEPFRYPVRSIKAGLRRLSKMLEVVVMDQDRRTRDDPLGSITLILEDLLLPDDTGQGCGVASLGNRRVNLFDAAVVRSVRHRDAVFPREVTGFWPLLKKKKTGGVKASGSVRLTLQLLTAREAAKCPAAQGNKAWSLNRYPKLTKPKREHGRIRDKLVLGPLMFVESVIARFTMIPILPAFLYTVLVAAFLFTKVKSKKGLE